MGWQPVKVVVLNDLRSFVGFGVLRQKLHLDLLYSAENNALVVLLCSVLKTC